MSHKPTTPSSATVLPDCAAPARPTSTQQLRQQEPPECPVFTFKGDCNMWNTAFRTYWETEKPMMDCQGAFQAFLIAFDVTNQDDIDYITEMLEQAYEQAYELEDMFEHDKDLTFLESFAERFVAMAQFPIAATDLAAATVSTVVMVPIATTSPIPASLAAIAVLLSTKLSFVYHLAHHVKNPITFFILIFI
jgi:hypothetical protein